MSTTTEILFNSPALHSLKRDQLVKLCKIHSIKASGKNVDLIDRLKQHALTLPKDAPLSIASRSEGNTVRANTDAERSDKENDQPKQIPRQSEQWEMVMETINEDDERSNKSNEFGSRSSKRAFVL
jgi:hypothetical protein